MSELLGFVTVCVVGLVVYHSKAGRFWRIAFLHSTNEVGATADRRYEVASRMLQLSFAHGTYDSGSLHKALDVLLCEGKFESIPVASQLHRRYWELGHRVATEILRHQKVLNIQGYWFAETYESAKDQLARR
jgi:hypothetical protein